MTAIKGYTPLSDQQKEEMNSLKEIEEQILRSIDNMERKAHIYDPRSLALGKTNLQQAFMWLNRAIAKPQRVQLEGDPANPEEILKD